MYSNYYYNVEQNEKLTITYWKTKNAINCTIKNCIIIPDAVKTLKKRVASLYVRNEINEIEKDALIDYINVLY